MPSHPAASASRGGSTRRRWRACTQRRPLRVSLARGGLRPACPRSARPRSSRRMLGRSPAGGCRRRGPLLRPVSPSGIAPHAIDPQRRTPLPTGFRARAPSRPASSAGQDGGRDDDRHLRARARARLGHEHGDSSPGVAWPSPPTYRRGTRSRPRSTSPPRSSPSSSSRSNRVAHTAALSSGSK